jgi:hypothetical protein
MNEDKYSPFIADEPILDYCKKKVEPFYISTGHLEIDATTHVLGIGMKIASVEGTAENYLNLFGDQTFCVNILYTPNHFQPLYEGRYGD